MKGRALNRGAELVAISADVEIGARRLVGVIAVRRLETASLFLWIRREARMNKPSRALNLSVLGLLAVVSPGVAQESPHTAAPHPKHEGAAPGAPAIDPAAVTALERMGAFLREQKSMEIKAETRTDQVLDSGQKIQLGAEVDMKVQRPDRLRVDVVSDRKNRQFYFDGKTFTIYGARAGYYATVPAPSTIGQLIEVAGRRYGIEFPMADLFFWGTEKSGIGDIKSAVSIGPDTVAGVECDQYAFRQADVDWQIWIQQGAQPLPRKMVVTSKREEGQPQHEVVMTWDLSPRFADSVFAFVPPKGAMPIALEDMEKARQAHQGRTAEPDSGGKP